LNSAGAAWLAGKEEDVSGRSWSGQWGIAHREWQPRAEVTEGPILNRLAGRKYRINETREGEWTVKWLDAGGQTVAWFGGDVRLVFVALQHLADKTESVFGIEVDRIWRREPELTGALQALSDVTVRAPKDNSTAPRKRPRRKAG
jgi:hypothetical protein